MFLYREFYIFSLRNRKKYIYIKCVKLHRCTECVDSTYCNVNCWDEARTSFHRWECLGNQMGLWQQIGIAYLAVRMLFKCTTDDNRLNEVQELVTNFSKLQPCDVISYGIVSV